MKYPVFIFILFFIVISAVRADVVELYVGLQDETFAADSQPYFLCDTVKSFATLPNGERKIVRQLVRQRDHQGHIVKEMTWGLSSENGILNESLIPYSLNENVLDTAGRVVSAVRKQYDIDVDRYFDFIKQQYRYNDDGTCVLTRFHKNTKDEWILMDSSRISATFNDNYLPVEILIQKVDSSLEWMDSVMISLQYDSLTRVSQRLTYLWNGLSWNLQSQQRYDYTEKNIANISSRVWSNGKWRKPQYSLAGHQVKLLRQACFSLYEPHPSNEEKFSIQEQKTNNERYSKKREINTQAKKGFYVNAGKERATITIFNAKGRQLYNRTARGVTYIDFSPWGKGNYSLRITQNGKILTRRIRIN